MKKSYIRERLEHASALAGALSSIGGDMAQYAVDQIFDEIDGYIENREALLEDWHAAVLPDDAPCGPDEWRQRNRSVVKIADMDDDHLRHCVRFAVDKKQHTGKLGALVDEQKRREG